MNTLEIKKGWFRSAGVQYKWLGKGYDIRGIGIAEKLLRTNLNLKVIVDNIPYLLETSKALNFIDEFKSWQTMKKQRLGVVSKTLLTPLNKVEIKEKPIINQMKLL